MDTKIDKDAVNHVAKHLVGRFLETKRAVALGAFYHDAVEALIHPYNVDAVETIRGLVGAARKARADGELTDEPDMRQMILDGEAVLAHLGIEPLEVTEDPEGKAVVAKMVADAEEFLLSHIPPEVFEATTNESRPN